MLSQEPELVKARRMLDIGEEYCVCRCALVDCRYAYRRLTQWLNTAQEDNPSLGVH